MDSVVSNIGVITKNPSLVAGKLQELCRRYHVRRMSVFGSRIHGNARPESDLDILVEFEPGHTPGFAFARLADELSNLLGREVDLHTRNSLSRFFRDQVLSEAKVLYAAQE